MEHITGVMFYYYFVCTRKLWYFSNNVVMEQENENVLLGKLLDEDAYKRDDKHINIDNVINIDFIRAKKILHEVKKSDKIEEASIWQVKYYLYYLKKRDVFLSGQLDYPLLKETKKIELEADDEKYIEEILDKIQEIVKQEKPPQNNMKKICKKCAYYDLCSI